MSNSKFEIRNSKQIKNSKFKIRNSFVFSSFSYSHFFRISCFGFFVFFLLFALPAFAQVDTGIDRLADSGLGTADIRITIANIIRVFLGVLGTIAIALVLYGGFLWMTAGGNEDKITKAKQLLVNAAIGLAIILAAYGITAFIIGRLLDATGAGGDGSGGAGGGAGGGRGSLGSGIIESHYPVRNATGIPRNTKILVTFKEPIQRDTIHDTKSLGYQLINSNNIKLRKTIANPPTSTDFITNIAATTLDDKTFVFTPLTLLGSPSEPISYTMRLDRGIKKQNGDAAFGQFGSFYEWQFEVSTAIDTTPPTVKSALPQANTTQPRNAAVQVTFSEAIDPTVVVGDEKISKFEITSPGNKRISGKTTIANEYRTIEFVTNDLCGKNSCGGDVFCLPANTNVQVSVPSAHLMNATSDTPFQASLPFSGVVDLAGNALDGNSNGKVDGLDQDSYWWKFATNDTIDLVPPTIVSLSPSQNASRIPLDADIRATFSKPLLASSFNASSVALDPVINYWTAIDDVQGKGVGIIRHDAFAKNTSYAPTITSGVKDLYQNCYFPCAGLSCVGKTWTDYPSCKLP